MRRIFFCSMLLSFFTSCENAIQLDATTTEKIVYNFYDSSVPPEYHRSYEITVSKSAVSIIVDSYGDTLATECQSFNSDKFEDFIQSVNNAELTHSVPKNELACSGSTGESLKIYTDKLLLNTYLDHCQVDEFPSKCGDLRSVINQMKAFFPNLDELLK